MADDQETRITLRLPTRLRDQLARSAEETNRSMNGEIVARLELTFDAEAIKPDSANIQRALADAAKIAEQAARDARYNAKVLSWLAEQQSVLFELIRSIAESDGHLSPDFLHALRQVVNPRDARDTGFPQPDGDET